MGFTLHLVADFDEVWLPSAYDVPAIRRLERFLNRFPGIVFSLFTARSLPSALECLEVFSDLLPRHWVTEGGAVMHHLGERGAWSEDPEYLEWLACTTQEQEGEPGLHAQASIPPESWNGERRAIAIGFLEAQWDTPRPLVVVGNPWKDRSLLQLADIPVLTRSPSRKLDVPGGLFMPQGLPLATGILEVLRSMVPAGDLDEGLPNALHDVPQCSTESSEMAMGREGISSS